MSMFPLRLKALRKEHGENQEQAAKHMGVTRSAYSSYERNINVPPYMKLKKIANHYGVTVEYIMGQTNLRQPDQAIIPADDSIMDVYDETVKIAEMLMDKTAVVMCKGEPLVGEHKEDALLYVTCFIKFMDCLSKYIIPKGED